MRTRSAVQDKEEEEEEEKDLSDVPDHTDLRYTEEVRPKAVSTTPKPKSKASGAAKTPRTVKKAPAVDEATDDIVLDFDETDAEAAPGAIYTSETLKTPKTAGKAVQKAPKDSSADKASKKKGLNATAKTPKTAKKAAKAAGRAASGEQESGGPASQPPEAADALPAIAVVPPEAASDTPPQPPKDSSADKASKSKDLKATRKTPKTAKKVAKIASKAASAEQTSGDAANQPPEAAGAQPGTALVPSEAAPDTPEQPLATQSPAKQSKRKSVVKTSAAQHEIDAALPSPAFSDDDNDDDAPEEVSLKSGKVAAAEQRRAEREADAAVRQAAKEKRRRRSEAAAQALAAAEVPAEGDEVVEDGTAAAAPAGGPEAKQEAGPSGEDADMLPADVIDALQAQARERAAEKARRQAEGQEAGISDDTVEKQQRKRARLTERRLGPVTVQVLNAKQPSKPSESAVEFARQRLHGARLQRSSAMLQPTRFAGTAIHCAAPGFTKRR